MFDQDFMKRDKIQEEQSLDIYLSDSGRLEWKKRVKSFV